jgi:hypothetical protein
VAVEVVVAVALVLNAAVVGAGDDDAVAVGAVAGVEVGADAAGMAVGAAAVAAAGVKERVEVVLAERRKDIVADNSVPNLTELLVNVEEDIGS